MTSKDAPALLLLVVTGSRDWTDQDMIHRVLDEEVVSFAKENKYVKIRLLHGDCPTGADRIAREWAKHRTYVTDLPMRAQWGQKGIGNRAGPRRNEHMAAVADHMDMCGWKVRCHAFGLAISRGGTIDCVKQLRNHGLSVLEHEQKDLIEEYYDELEANNTPGVDT